MSPIAASPSEPRMILTNKMTSKILTTPSRFVSPGWRLILKSQSAFLTLYTGYDYLRKGIDHAISEDEKN